ncbi:ABC transporter ATP-binding protein [Brevibacterium samyangense]|uniref:ABC transporter ATP-binding protein n=1 Tax=Brevibacterium samyangense TaxID=366888 RepID=A0ABP5EF52_9MICO
MSSLLTGSAFPDLVDPALPVEPERDTATTPKPGAALEPGSALEPGTGFVLDLTGLTVTYAPRRRAHRAGPVTPAVSGVDLRVRPGEVLALVGESGSGKSTTAAVAAGLLDASARVEARTHTLFGTDVRGASEKAWRRFFGTRIGYVPQDTGSGLNPVRRIGAQIAESLRVHGVSAAEARTRMLAALAEVGLDDVHAERYPHELSGGQRQRVLIALALAGRPGLVVADEPTSALDVTVQKQVLDLLEDRVRSTGTALVLITHDLGIARDRADALMVMERGTVVESGPARQVLDAPQHPYTQKLLAAAPGLGSRGGATSDAATPEAETSAPAPAVITATGLTRTFVSGGRAHRAVDGVDVEVRRGTTLGIVGESGSGKSTTARMLLGLEQVDAGSLTVLGHTLARDAAEPLTAAQRRDLTRRARLVHQDPTASLDPRYPVGRSIAEPLRGFGIGTRSARAERVRELLDLVALPAAVVDRRPRELSGGQRQRVAIARALAVDPELLVLDEPVSALDVSVQAQILDLLTELQAELGLTYVFISHDLAVVEGIADDVLVMAHGKVVESGPVREVFTRPRTDLTRALLDAVPGLTHDPASRPTQHSSSRPTQRSTSRPTQNSSSRPTQNSSSRPTQNGAS